LEFNLLKNFEERTEKNPQFIQKELKKMSDDQGIAKEMKTLDTLQDHLRCVMDSVKELGSLIENWLKGNKASIKTHIEKLETIEDQANKIKWKLLDDISEAETMLRQQDYMRLVLTIDEIVDYAEGTSHRISMLEAWEPDPTSATYIRDMMDALSKMISTLREVVFVLTQNMETSQKMARTIYDIERDIDRLHRAMLKHVFSLNLDYKTLYIAANFTDHLEQMADIVESVTDAIRIIAVARKGGL
jgi:predicted phosphate transport protein (TIGR00153 family)